MTGLTEPELDIVSRAAAHAVAACEAAGFDVYDPRGSTSPDQHPEVSAAEVYATDRARISHSDVLVCIADRPSFGVGLEVTIAQARMVPVVLVAHRDMPLSRMLAGSPGLTAGRPLRRASGHREAADRGPRQAASRHRALPVAQPATTSSG